MTTKDEDDDKEQKDNDYDDDGYDTMVRHVY